jgi:hypothetical protein
MNRHRLDDASPPAERVRALLIEAGIVSEDDSNWQVEGNDERDENVGRLLEDIQAYQKQVSAPSLAGYLQQVQLVSDVDAVDPELGAVSLMTVHAAKGLEFPLVFVIGMEEGLFPHANAIAAGAVEEERRLCYVAVTRAMERLYLSRARERRGFGESRRNPPSRFLAELPHEAVHGHYAPPGPYARRSFRTRAVRPTKGGSWPPDSFQDAHEEGRLEPDGLGYRPGMTIWHSQLGAGRVVTVGRGLSGTLTVDFPDIGEMSVRADFVSPYDG